MKFQDLSERNQGALAEIILGLPKGEHTLYAKYGQAWGSSFDRPARPYYEIKINKKDTTFSAIIKEVVEFQEALAMTTADLAEDIKEIEGKGTLTFKQFITDMNKFVKDIAERTDDVVDVHLINTREERLDRDEGGNGGMYLTSWDAEIDGEDFDFEIDSGDIREYFDETEGEQAMMFLDLSPKNAEYQTSVDDKTEHNTESGGSYEDLEYSYTLDWWWDKDAGKIIGKGS